jgi:hypothetical protein
MISMENDSQQKKQNTGNSQQKKQKTGASIQVDQMRIGILTNQKPSNPYKNKTIQQKNEILSKNFIFFAGQLGFASIKDEKPFLTEENVRIWLDFQTTNLQTNLDPAIQGLETEEKNFAILRNFVFDLLIHMISYINCKKAERFMIVSNYMKIFNLDNLEQQEHCQETITTFCKLQTQNEIDEFFAKQQGQENSNNLFCSVQERLKKIVGNDLEQKILDVYLNFYPIETLVNFADQIIQQIFQYCENNFITFSSQMMNLYEKDLEGNFMKYSNEVLAICQRSIGDFGGKLPSFHQILQELKQFCKKEFFTPKKTQEVLDSIQECEKIDQNKLQQIIYSADNYLDKIFPQEEQKKQKEQNPNQPTTKEGVQNLQNIWYQANFIGFFMEKLNNMNKKPLLICKSTGQNQEKQQSQNFQQQQQSQQISQQQQPTTTISTTTKI